MMHRPPPGGNGLAASLHEQYLEERQSLGARTRWPHRCEIESAMPLSQGLENIDFAQYWEDMAKWSFGHPAIRTYDEQRVLVTFYAGPPGCLSIHSAIVRR